MENALHLLIMYINLSSEKISLPTKEPIRNKALFMCSPSMYNHNRILENATCSQQHLTRIRLNVKSIPVELDLKVPLLGAGFT